MRVEVIMRKVARAIGIVVMAVGVLLVGDFVVRDIRVYINGGRPQSATVDGLCDIFFRPKRNNLIARVPLIGDRLQLTVSHKWRGNYQFKLLIPGGMADNVTATEQIGLVASFFDREGNLIYVNRTPPSPYSSWNRAVGNLPLGYAMSFRMYLAPDDVPLDDELTVKVEFCGQFDNFYAAHSNACLVLIKERDK